MSVAQIASEFRSAALRQGIRISPDALRWAATVINATELMRLESSERLRLYKLVLNAAVTRSRIYIYSGRQRVLRSRDMEYAFARVSRSLRYRAGMKRGRAFDIRENSPWCQIGQYATKVLDVHKAQPARWLIRDE